MDTRAVFNMQFYIVIRCDYRLGSHNSIQNHLLGKSLIQNLSSFLINSVALSLAQ
jgi:hypothetical protein